MDYHRILVGFVFAFTLILFSSYHLPFSNAVAGEKNIVANPGFEDFTSSAWMSTSTIGGGKVALYDATRPHSDLHSAMLNATQPDAATKASCQQGSGCKDFVRATVQQYLPLSSNVPSLDSLSNSASSFSAWWWVDEPTQYGMAGTYSLHAQIAFYDTNSRQRYSLEYWYGTSDLTIPPNVDLGPIPSIGSWFQFSRNLTADIQPLNIVNPSSTKVDYVWFGAFGNTIYGERAYVDDVAISFVPHPIPLFSANPAVGSAPLTVSFDGTGTTETAGGPGITNYKWSFGDGSPDASSGNSRVTHRYTIAGNFTVVLVATDANGQSRTISSRIIVTGVPGGLENGFLGPAVAGAFGIVLVGGLILLRGRSHHKKIVKGPRKYKPK